LANSTADTERLSSENSSKHKTPAIHRWLAKRPRFHLHFTPTGASWLNQVERWFALLTERQIRRGVHRSTRDQILESLKRFLLRTSETGH
jgi:transposase